MNLGLAIYKNFTMEPTKNVMKEVLRAAHQFHNNSAQLTYLLRQLENLQTISSRSAYIRQLHSSDQVELAECLTFLVDVVREKHGHFEMVQHAVSILLNLSQDEDVKKLLHETLNLCPPLVSLVVAYSGLTEEEQTLSDAMQLLQRITYGHRMDYHHANVEDLLRFLLPHVLSKTESLLVPVLGTLANLCRNNLLVQAAIRNKGHSELKRLLKTLCEFLDSPNNLLVIFSLSVFTSLCLNESEGQKMFFDGSNVEQTLQTIFGIIKNSFRTVAWKYAADLLTDLLRHPQMQICIKKYRHLPKCVNDILSLLAASTEDCIPDMFELVLSLCALPSVRQTVNCRLLTPLAQNSVSSSLMLEATSQALAPEAEPLLVCVHWASQEVTPRSRAACLALDFLIDSCQDCLCTAEKSYPVHLLTPVVTHLLSRPEQTNSVEKTIRLGRRLSVLQPDKHCRELLASHLKLDVVAFLVDKHTSLSGLSYAASSTIPAGDDKAREEGCHCVLLLLDLALKVRKYVPGLAEYLESTLKTAKLMDFLALGLTSSSQEQVEMSLRLLCFSLGLDNARPDIVLCGSIACLNEQKQSSKRIRANWPSPQKAAGGSDSNHGNKENRPPMALIHNHGFLPEHKGKVGLDRSGKDETTNVDILIEKMEGIIGPKDTKTAEVIEVFEHHIRSLQIKEEHLNNLLEAKSLALTQADRVIAQFRGRQAAHSAEMTKLQNVLKESERRIEQIVSQMNDMKIEAERMKAQYEAQIDRKKEEIEALCQEKEEMVERCAELEEKVANCRHENKTLSALMSALQDAHEVLKEQYNLSCSLSKQLEEERKMLSKQLKDRDAMLQKQSVTLQTVQAKYKETEEERAELEKEKENMEAYVDKLQHQLSSSENTCRQLQQRVTVLESVNQDLEGKLKQKTDRVEELEAELDKHNQIVSFINNMQLKGGAGKK